MAIYKLAYERHGVSSPVELWKEKLPCRRSRMPGYLWSSLDLSNTCLSIPSEMDEALTTYGLGPVDDSARQQLGRVLWKWKLCGSCNDKPSCGQSSCVWNQADSFSAFWDIYERMTEAYSPAHLGRSAALTSHKDLLNIIEEIQRQPNVPRKTLVQNIFEGRRAGDDELPEERDQERAFSIAASILLLMDFRVLHDAANIMSGNTLRVSWRDDVSAAIFVEEAFPSRPVPDLQHILIELKAKRLTKSAKLRLEPTNDIRRHLVLDKKRKTLWIFHHMAALRQLLATNEDDTSICLLPQQMMLEVLHTIHAVLFPLDSASQKLLRRLVNKHDWDKGLLADVSTPHQKDNDLGFPCRYFGERLKDLHRELQNPTPHTWLRRRLKRRSETYMLMATMYGVIIAVTLGFLSLVAAIFQSWVTWQQWKHPVN